MELTAISRVEFYVKVPTSTAFNNCCVLMYGFMLRLSVEFILTSNAVTFIGLFITIGKSSILTRLRSDSYSVRTMKRSALGVPRHTLGCISFVRRTPEVANALIELLPSTEVGRWV